MTTLAPRLVFLATAAVAIAAAGCGDDAACGPAEAPADGISLAVDGDTLAYGNFTSSPNNDCPDGNGGPTSLTLAGEQVSPAGSGFALTFCLPSPENIGADPIDLDDTLVQVIDVRGQIDDCQVARDSSATPTGTITFTGYCADGVDPAGYAIELSATFAGTRTCAGEDEAVEIILSGRAAVSAINL